MTLRTPKCPNCRKALHDFNIDFENVRIICASCQKQIDPAILIDDFNVDFFAQIIPDEHKEQFLNKIGFERKPIVRTSKLALTFMITAILIAVIVGTFIQYKNILQALLYLLIGGSFIVIVLGYYKEETKPKWRWKKKT